MVEVYDHPQPAPRIERILLVEALAARARVVRAVVGKRNRREDQVDVLEQPAAATLEEVQPRARVEDDLAAVGSVVLALGPSSGSLMARAEPSRDRLGDRRSFCSSQRAGEPVGELACRARVQVALGRRDPRVAHGSLDGRQVDAAGHEEGAVGVP